VRLTACPVTAPAKKTTVLAHPALPAPLPRTAPRRCSALAARHSRFRCVLRPCRPTGRPSSPAASPGIWHGPRARSSPASSGDCPGQCDSGSEISPGSSRRSARSLRRSPTSAGLPPAWLHPMVTAWRLYGTRYPPDWAAAGASTSARGRAQNGLFWNLPIGERSAARALKAAGLQAALEHALTCYNIHSIACFGAHSAYAGLYRCVVVSRRAGPGLASGYGTDCGGGGRDSRAGVRDAAGR
jgi:hypothetical protein